MVSDEAAISMFRKVRTLVGYDIRDYKDLRLLSPRQVVASNNAIRLLSADNYVDAFRELHDFMHNYNENRHYVSNAEYCVINLILTLFENKHDAVELETSA